MWEQWLAVANSGWPVAGQWLAVASQWLVGLRRGKAGEVRCEVGGHSCDGRRYSSASSSSASEGPASDAAALSFLPLRGALDEALEPFCEHVARAQR